MGGGFILLTRFQIPENASFFLQIEVNFETGYLVQLYGGLINKCQVTPIVSCSYSWVKIRLHTEIQISWKFIPLKFVLCEALIYYWCLPKNLEFLINKLYSSWLLTVPS